MKKILALMLALALMATAFTGCGEQAGTDNGADNSTADSATETTIESDYYLSDYFTEDGFFKDITSSDYVTLPDYKSIVVPKEDYTPTEAQIKYEIEQLLAGYSTQETLTEGVVADGDTLNIDYVGSIDGVEFSGGSTGGNGTEVTIGVTQYIDDFLQQLIGHKVGENFDIEVTFPENYGVADLNGKDAIFNITINSIIKTVVPELTDDFCAENFDKAYNTVEKFKAKLTEELSREMVNSYLYTNVFNKAEIREVPAVVSDYVAAYILSTYEMQAMNYGYTLDEYIGMIGFNSREEFAAYFQSDIDLFCNDYLIFTAIAEKEGMKITTKDVKNYFETYLGTSDYAIAEELYGMPYLKFTVLQNDVLNKLIDETARG